MADTWCLVQIDFYKPTGFCDTWLVNTQHRGKAAQAVLDNYKEPQDITVCLNSIAVRFASNSEIEMGKKGLIPVLPVPNTPSL